MKAKQENGQLTYYTPGSTVKIGDKDVINPNDEMLLAEGYLDLIYRTGNGGTFREGDCWVVETPAQEPIPEPTNEERREIAYATEPIIDWEGKMRTCDFVRGLIFTYTVVGDNDKRVELVEKWIQGREVVKTMWPDEVEVEPII